MARLRLDRALEQRGYAQSRARARDAILRGTVRVNGAPAAKPGQWVAETDHIEVADPAQAYVSRAALKLIAALGAGEIAVAGKTCLDIGASTGGFTQVLIERGAARVYAVDVGHGQLHAKIADSPKIVALEGVNAKDLTPGLIPEPIDLLVCDVSFVSVAKILGPALALCRPTAAAVVLVKPQFEVGRDHIGKGGIVTDPCARAAALAGVVGFLEAEGWRHFLSLASPIAGGDGNQESVALFSRGDYIGDQR